MRDIMEEIFCQQPLDPTEAARRSARPQLRRRFYQNVHIVESADGHALALDGRPVRTPARRVLAVPARDLAEPLADEWRAQRNLIDPATMPLTRLANTIIDGVADAPDEVAADVTKFFASDLLCYRADRPAELVVLQSRAWDPVLDWVRAALGAHFVLGQGLQFAPQP